MGADNFQDVGVGKDATVAFSSCRETALWDHGHAGYSGTIAEKHSFQLFTLPELPEGASLQGFVELCTNAQWLDAQGDEEAWQIRGGADLIDGKWHPKPSVPCPPELRPFVLRVAAIADDKWGPAAAFDITETAMGQQAIAGRDPAQRLRAFVFFGYASS